MIDYRKRLVELDEILSCLSDEDYRKIPNDIIESIKYNKDKDYKWKFNKTELLKNQNLNRDTIIMLSYINTEYLLTEEQRDIMNKIFKLNKLNQENSLEQVDSNNLFKNEENTINANDTEKQNDITIYKENFLKAIIKKIFKK